MANFKEINENSGQNTKKLAELSPDVMAAFGQMDEKHFEGDVLDDATKELVFLAFSIALHCEPCIGAHMQRYIDAGGSRDMLKELAGIAIIMHGGPGSVYAGKVIEAFDQLSE